MIFFKSWKKLLLLLITSPITCLSNATNLIFQKQAFLKSLHVSIWLSYKKEILIFVADLKFIKETCRFKKKFQYFLRSSTIPFVSLKIELFHLFEFF